MKKIILLIILASGLSFQPAFSQCYFANTAFTTGEKLSYTGYYQLGIIWIAAGKVEISVDEEVYKGKKMYKVTGTGRSVKTFDSFYRLRDTMYSYMDIKTLTPHYFCIITNENKYYSKKTLEYDYTKGRVYYTKDRKRYIQRDTLAMKNLCYTDVLSIGYQSRTIDFEEIGQGGYAAIDMIVSGKTYKVYIRYLGYDTITTKKQKKYTCYKLAPVLPAGTMFKGSDMTVWLSKDERRVPIMVEAKVVIGKVKGIIDD